MEAGGKQCSSKSTITPTKTYSADIYRRIKRRLGHSFKLTHCKENLVSSRKQVAHKPLGIKSGLSGLKRVPRPLFKQHSPCSHRQHNKEGDEIGLPVCPTVENPGMVHQETEWSLHPEVFKAICSRWHQPQVDLFATRFNNYHSLCHRYQTPRHGCTVMEESDPYAFPPVAILGKVVEQLQDYPCNRIILIAPGWPNMSWFWDLVAMSSHIPLCQPNLPNLVSQPFNQTLQRNLSNLNLHAWQGFSEAVRT